MFTALFKNLIEFLYPKSAEVYELESLEPEELLRKLPPASDPGKGVIALFAYGDPRVRQAIHEIKYHRNQKLCESFAVILMDVLRTELTERALTESAHWRIPPLLVPMPMSAVRRRERGWNQTEMLCENILKLDDEKLFVYAPNALRKIRHTESQTLVGRSERLRNVVDTMEAESAVKGKCIVLIDDVVTTGATLNEAKRKLRLSGASKILCLALAH